MFLYFSNPWFLLKGLPGTVFFCREDSAWETGTECKYVETRSKGKMGHGEKGQALCTILLINLNYRKQPNAISAIASGVI